MLLAPLCIEEDDAAITDRCYLCVEQHCDEFVIHALVELLLVAELHVGLKIRPAHQHRDSIQLSAGAKSDLVVGAPHDQIDCRFDRRVAAADDDQIKILISLWVR